MVKVILGSAVGGLVAGGIALFAAGQARTTAGGAAMVPATVPASATVAPAGPTIACAPHHEATVARVIVNGTEAAMLTCVDRAMQGYVSYPQATAVPPSPFVSLPPSAAPVHVVPLSQPRPARQVVYRDRADEVVRYEPDVKRRSVAKTAMVIGGSAGAGAGVGAIVGGKKGALIGAALGGGAASIFEATKR